MLLVLLLLAASAAEEAEAKAKKALAEGRALEALHFYEEAYRAGEDTPSKRRIAEAYRAAGFVEPPGPTLHEAGVLALHVRAEKTRVWRAAAEAMEGAGSLHGALLLRRSILALQAEGSDGERAERERVAEILRKLTQRPTPRQKELAERAVRASRDAAALLEAARGLLAKGEWAAATRVCQELEFGDHPQDRKNEAKELRAAIEAAAADAVPPEQRAAAEKALADERFARLDVVASRHFLLLGPRAFVRSIPPEEKALLDLAYIAQSDLAAQPLTHDGERICVYYQETFDFGGGLAGGKLIRIGRRAIGLPVAGMLHYHELGHCVFGRGWLHEGFTEGLADFAAGFTLDLLGQTEAARAFIAEAREQFVRYFLGRKVPYHQIQPYRPSAGFLFSLLPPGDAPHDWTPYRRVFHRMREAQAGAWPDREHQLMRYFGHFLAQEYGLDVLDTLREWGFPVAREDSAEVAHEIETLLEATKRGEFALLKGQPEAAEAYFERALAEGPRSHLASRARHGLLRTALARGDAARADALAAELGLVRAFLVVGPFHGRGRVAHVVFPPETRVDLAEEVRHGIEAARWKPAIVDPDGYVDLLKQGFGYPENACAFALCHLRVEAETDANLCVGSDDGHALYLNGALLEKWDGSHPFQLDGHVYRVRLRAGWNRVLVKVHNGSGPWGFLLRVEKERGVPLDAVEISTEGREASFPPVPLAAASSVPLFADDFKSLSAARWRTGVGSWDARNGRLRPLAAAREGLWQRFLVDPDRPKDGPSGILWLHAPFLPESRDFAVELVAVGPGNALPPKFGMTIDGDFSDDGQSGHTFVLHPEDGKLACSWYRYDRLLYLQPGADVPVAESYVLALRRLGSKWSLHVNGVPLFDGVDAEPLPGFGVGILAWGLEPHFESFRISRLKAAATSGR
jgi:hypothetical protein